MGAGDSETEKEKTVSGWCKQVSTVSISNRGFQDQEEMDPNKIQKFFLKIVQCGRNGVYLLPHLQLSQPEWPQSVFILSVADIQACL